MPRSSATATTHTTPATDAAMLAVPATPPPTTAVLAWLLSGQSEHDIAEALRVQYPKCNVRRVMREVAGQMRAHGKPDADALRGWLLLSARELYRRAVEASDLESATRLLNVIARIGGVNSKPAPE